MIRRRSILDDHRLSEREQKNLTLLELIRRRSPLTRTALSQGSGFNIVTVSNYVGEFIKQGLVVERGFDVSSGGRKPVLVALNPKTAFAVGVDLGLMDLPTVHVNAVITDLRGQIVHQLKKPRQAADLDHVLGGAGEVLRELLKTSPIDTKKIAGIGMGVPGIFDERAATVRHPSRGGTRTNFVTIREQLETEFHLPVLMGNDATLAGYGEFHLGLDRPVENLVYFYAEVGASLILNNHIYWGSGGSAGELGIFLSSDDDYLSWTKSPQFVLSYDWRMELAERAKKLIGEGHATAIQELAEGKAEAITMDTILRAAQDGDPLARELIEHNALQLGIRIANLVNLLNPELVIIGGGIERAGSLLLEPVWRSVKQYAYEEPASLVDILPAQLGENAVALGAASWVIREVFTQA